MSSIHPRRGLWIVAAACALTAGPAVHTGKAGSQNPQPPRERIRVGVDLVTTPVTVRDHRGQFLADLKLNELELYEDGVRQTPVTFSLSHGGRVFDVARPPAQVLEGLVLPASRPPNDASGRIFLIFIDDQHLEASQTPRVRDLFARITKRLIHSGDMFGIVSTGPSSIQVDLTYDRKRLDQAAKKIMGNGLTAADVLAAPSGGDGPADVRHRAHVAFSTAYDLMGNLARIHDRSKAMIYVSNGYDLNPYSDAREKQEQERAGDAEGNPFRQQSTFSDADLGLAALRADARGRAGQRFDLHDRPPRLDRRTRHQPARRHGLVSEARVENPGHAAGARRADWRHTHREPQRFRQGSRLDRRRLERLLHGRLLLQQQRPVHAPAEDRDQGDAARSRGQASDRVPAEAAAAIVCAARRLATR